MEITKADEKNFKKADSCHICGIKYKSCDVRVRDHCHVTGKYKGSAHQKCNVNYKLTEKIPVIFHKLRGYDSHFMMQEIGSIGCKLKKKIYVIPNNVERHTSFMLGDHLMFLDSFQLMSRSLDYLASCLPEDAFKYTSKEFKNPNKLELLKKKGVYPYDYMDSFQRFKETKLPVKEEFHSILNDEHISDNEYEHARKV